MAGGPEATTRRLNAALGCLLAAGIGLGIMGLRGAYDPESRGVEISREETTGRYLWTHRDELPPGALALPGGAAPTGWEGLLLGVPLDPVTADAVDWRALPGVGPRTAEAIVETRAREGGFAHPVDVKKTPGIGDVKWQRIRPWLRNTGAAEGG